MWQNRVFRYEYIQNEVGVRHFPGWRCRRGKHGHSNAFCYDFLGLFFSFRFCLYLFVYPLHYVLFVLRTLSLITPLPVIYPSIGSSRLVLGLCKAVYLPSKAVLTILVLLSRCNALPLPYTDKYQ